MKKEVGLASVEKNSRINRQKESEVMKKAEKAVSEIGNETTKQEKGEEVMRKTAVGGNGQAVAEKVTSVREQATATT